MKLRLPPPATALLLLLAVVGPAPAQQLAWEALLGPATDDDTEVVAVEAVPERGADEPARAYLACNIDKNKVRGASGLVACASDTAADSWPLEWNSYVLTDGAVELSDLAIDPQTGTVWVCGSYHKSMVLQGTSIFFARPSGPHGFIARIDPDNGTWLGAFETPDVVPHSIVVGAGRMIYVTGPGALAAKYAAPGGARQWLVPAAPATIEWAQIALGPDPADPFLYVMSRDSGDPGSEDVLVSQLLQADGAPGWALRMGSPGEDMSGGLDVGRDGDLRLSYSSTSSVPSFAGAPVAEFPATPATRTIVARVGAEGAARWIRPVGSLADGQAAKMLSHDLDIDDKGNTWLAAQCDASWVIRGVRESFQNDAVLFGVDGAGKLFGFSRSVGPGAEIPLAVSAPRRELALIGGYYISAGETEFGPDHTLPVHPNPGLFVAVGSTAPTQELYVFRPDLAANETAEEFAIRLSEAGVQVYATADDGLGGFTVSGYATDSQVGELLAGPGVSFESVATMVPNGVVEDAGWALARMNDGGTQIPPGEIQPFQYPETTEPVLLYLIDTAVADPNDWFAGNVNLTIEDSILIRGAGDPTESSEFEHATRMLSILAGPETGAAVGTPVRVINYDIYPGGGTTTSALLAKAVVEAVQHHRADPSGDPGVLCIASSSESGATSPTLRAAIDLAVAEGLTVVVSAGNHGGDVSQYIPASYGVAPGIVCAGASTGGNQRLAMSNAGAAVDLCAPGEAVRALRFSDPASGQYDEMSGTSPAAALTAAAALVGLSGSPTLSPAALEAALLADAYPAAVSLAQIGPGRTAFQNWARGYGIEPADPDGDPDGDGTVNLLEYFHGCDPTVADRQRAGLSMVAGGGGMTVEFEVDSALFDAGETTLFWTVGGSTELPESVLLDPANPMQLLDQTEWQLEESSDLETWTPVGGTLMIGAEAGGRIPLAWAAPTGQPSRFVRLKVTPVE